MQLALRGLGDTYCYTDMGGGITPANYQSQCCLPVIGANPFSTTCSAWAQQNGPLFAGNDPCSPTAAQILGLNIPVCASASAIPNPPPVSAPMIDTDPNSPTYGQAITPTTGQAVSSSTDAAAVLSAQIAAQVAAENASVKAAVTGQASTQCANRAIACSGNTLLTVPTSDCTGCKIDFSSSTVWLGIAAIAAAFYVLSKFR